MQILSQYNAVKKLILNCSYEDSEKAKVLNLQIFQSVLLEFKTDYRVKLIINDENSFT